MTTYYNGGRPTPYVFASTADLTDGEQADVLCHCTVSGRYLPGTRDDPPEHPTVELHDVTRDDGTPCELADGELGRLQREAEEAAEENDE